MWNPPIALTLEEQAHRIRMGASRWPSQSCATISTRCAMKWSPDLLRTAIAMCDYNKAIAGIWYAKQFLMV